MSDKERKQLNAECGILAQVKHPNIVEYYTKDHVKADASLHLYVVRGISFGHYDREGRALTIEVKIYGILWEW
jgi:hypothetical protein